MAVNANDFQFTQNEEAYADGLLRAHNESEAAHPDLQEKLEGCFSALGNVVQKVDGMGLSANDYSDAEKQKVVSALASISSITEALQNIGKELGLMVRQEEGKGLSSNDFTGQDRENLSTAHRKAGSNEKAIEAHTKDGVLHITDEERRAWNAVGQQAQKASLDASRAVNLAITAEMLDSGQEPMVKKTDDGEAIVVHFGIPAGRTPEKGVDYWTEEDKAEIQLYVEEAILGGAW